MSDLVKVENTAVMEWTTERVDLLKRTICKGASNDELRLFMNVCQRTGLDPFARQIYAIKRWDSKENREIMQATASIDGFRLIAQRSGQYAGQLGPYWCSSDGKWVDVWLEDSAPSASKVGVLRHDFKEPCWGIARYSSYCQYKKNGEPFSVWKKMPELMLAKCGESLALRRAFPQELSGIYTNEEMGSMTIDQPQPPGENVPRETTTQFIEPGINEPQKHVGGEDFGPYDSSKDTRPVTEAQLKRLYAITKKQGLSSSACKEIIEACWGLDKSTDLKRNQYDLLCNAILAEKDPAAIMDKILLEEREAQNGTSSNGS